MDIVRRRLIYEGRVQGVGFRMTARRLSVAFPIAGFVRNLGDGGVELVVEGESESLSSYLQSIQREFGDMIRNVQESPTERADEPLSGFTIRY